MTGRLHHLILDAADLEAEAAFWSALLGQPVTYRSDDFVVVAADDRTSGLAFQLAPDVVVDNEWSNRHTVIEVSGLDRTGLLYDLTTAISGRQPRRSESGRSLHRRSRSLRSWPTRPRNSSRYGSSGWPLK